MNSDPLLISGKYWKISLNRYETKARIGAYQHERLLPQRLRLNVSVYVELRLNVSVYVEKGAAPVSELSEVFNYDRVIEAIEAVVQEGHIDLQETLLERTAERLLKYPEVAAVQIGSEKPDAYSKAESIGVEAFFSKDKERIKTE